MTWKLNEEYPIFTQSILKKELKDRERTIWTKPEKLSSKEIDKLNNDYKPKEYVTQIVESFYKILSNNQIYGLESELGIIERISLGITSKNEINFIGLTELRNLSPQAYKFNEFYFLNNKPIGSSVHFRLRRVTSENYWPANFPPIITKEIENEFLKIVDFKPDAISNLEICLNHLTNPSPRIGNGQTQYLAPINSLNFE